MSKEPAPVIPIVREPAIPFAPPHYVCRKTEIPFPGEPDGDLGKTFWQQAEFISDFHDIEGDRKPLPLKKTSVKMLWDDEALYIGARLEDDTIWATVSERDHVVFADNDFEVFLAPKDSTHRYYELEMNAMNTVWDLLMEKPARDAVHRIISWDIHGLKSAVHVEGRLNDAEADNRFWSLELIIPWFSLRECEPEECWPSHIAPDPGEMWRLNFSRVEYRVDRKDGEFTKQTDPATGQPYPEYNWVWAPTGIIDIHMPEMWGYLLFADSGAAADGAVPGSGAASDAGSGCGNVSAPENAGVQEFRAPEDEQAVWQLRKLYYREHAWKREHGSFTDSFEDLREKDKWDISPRIYVTPSLFEIIADRENEAGQTELHIRQDGYFWRS